ncbi:hypothetical protein ACVGWQ_17285, partial [Enterobacter hormaechei]
MAYFNQLDSYAALSNTHLRAHETPDNFSYSVINFKKLGRRGIWAGRWGGRVGGVAGGGGHV